MCRISRRNSCTGSRADTSYSSYSSSTINNYQARGFSFLHPFGVFNHHMSHRRFQSPQSQKTQLTLHVTSNHCQIDTFISRAHFVWFINIIFIVAFSRSISSRFMLIIVITIGGVFSREVLHAYHLQGIISRNIPYLPFLEASITHIYNESM